MEHKLSLFEINQKYLELINQVDTETGEITPEVAEALTITIAEAGKKGEAYISIIKKFDSDINLLKQYRDQADLLIKRHEKKIDVLKANLLQAVESFGEIHTPLYKIGIRKSNSIEVIDIDKIPNEYKVTKMTTQADKTKIKEAIKNGEVIDGVEYIENHNLSIR